VDELRELLALDVLGLNAAALPDVVTKGALRRGEQRVLEALDLGPQVAVDLDCRGGSSSWPRMSWMSSNLCGAWPSAGASQLARTGWRAPALAGAARRSAACLASSLKQDLAKLAAGLQPLLLPLPVLLLPLPLLPLLLLDLLLLATAAPAAAPVSTAKPDGW